MMRNAYVKYSTKKSNNKGFTLIETILGLLVVSISVLLISGYLQLVSKIDYDFHYGEDEVSIRQLRLIYVLSSSITIDDQRVCFDYMNNELCLYQKDDKLILTPGYQVFMKDLKSVIFSRYDNCLYLQYHHKNQTEEKRVIGCE